MRDRSVLVRDYPQGDGKVVRVTVSYHKDVVTRGYWLHIQPMRLEVFEGRTLSRYFPTDGHRKLILPAKRFSQTGLAQASAMAEGQLESDDAVRTRVAYSVASLAEHPEV